MRYIGYILLFLLFLYFSFVKPYMLLRGIQVELRGFYIDAKGKKIGVESFLLFVPSSKGRTLFIGAKSVSLGPEGIYAGSVSVIEVSKEVSKEPFDYDFTHLVKLSEKVKARAGKVYVSINTLPLKESITVFVGDTKLERGNITSHEWSRVFYMKGNSTHQLYVLLKEAHAKGGIFYADDVIVTATSYTFYGRGEWRGKEGNFYANGFIKGYESENFKVPVLKVQGKGKLTYTSLKVDFSVETDLLEIKGRNMGSLSGRGEYTYTFGKEERIRGSFTAGESFVSIDYRIHPDDILYANFKNVPLDNHLLRIDTPFRLALWGSLTLYPTRKELSLKGFSENLFFLEQSFRGINVELSLDYSKNAGKIYLSVNDPAKIILSGYFSKKDFEGDLSVYMLPYTYEGFSAYINYLGSVSYREGVFHAYGSGKLIKPIYRDVSPGDITFNINLADDNYGIVFSGIGFGGEGKGSIKERVFAGTVLFKGFSMSYTNLKVDNLVGGFALKISPAQTQITGGGEALLTKDEVSALVRAGVDLTKGGDWHGTFSAHLQDIRRGDLHVNQVDIKGRVRKSLISAEYSSKYAKGRVEYSLSDSSFSSSGELSIEEGDYSAKAHYTLHGRKEGFSAQLSGQGSYKGYNFPLRASLTRESGKLRGFVKGFSTKVGLLSVSLADSFLEGTEDKGILKLGDITLSINSERLLTVQSSSGQLSIKDRSFLLPLSLSGGLRGKAEVSYGESGLSISSQGVLDLEKLSSLIKSRVFTYAKGEISYTLQKEGKFFRVRVFSAQDIEVRSRFLAVPLKGRVYALYNGKVWEGFANLKGDDTDLKAQVVGDDKLLSVKLATQRLPILFRSESVRFNGFAKANGEITTDYRKVRIKADVDLSGNLIIKNIARKIQEKPEGYKLIDLDIKLSTAEPLRISLPEGYIYSYADGQIKGSLYKPDYRVKLSLVGGSLEYFNREFHVREGTLLMSPERTTLDLTMMAPTPDYNIIIGIKGDAGNPKAFVRSEPPRDTREVLTSLILGGPAGEGMFSLSSALVAQFPEFSKLLQGVEKAIGTDVRVNISPTTSPTGEAAVNTKVSKDITNRLNIEYQQSTLKDPKETYGGANVKITPNTSVGVKVYSNNAQEYKVRFRKKFDF